MECFEVIHISSLESPSGSLWLPFGSPVLVMAIKNIYMRYLGCSLEDGVCCTVRRDTLQWWERMVAKGTVPPVHIYVVLDSVVSVSGADELHLRCFLMDCLTDSFYQL